MFVTYTNNIDHFDKNKILLTVRFKKNGQINAQKGVPTIDIALEELSGSNKKHQEIWLSSIPIIDRYSDKNLCWSHNGEILLIAAMIKENKTSNLQLITQKAYQKIAALQKKLGFPYSLRIWNYFPNIHDDEYLTSGTKIERYKAFCLGREFSLKQQHLQYLPAATAIGSQGKHLQLIFLATKTAGIPIENPRQISAFCYPKQYGPASPSFSRAILKHWDKRIHFYISGTASITSHRSQHLESIELQLKETLKNIEILIKKAHDQEKLPLETIDELSILKVYIRHPKLFNRIKDYLSQYLSKELPIIFLQGAICRKELLIEIEACYISQ